MFDVLLFSLQHNLKQMFAFEFEHGKAAPIAFPHTHPKDARRRAMQDILYIYIYTLPVAVFEIHNRMRPGR